MTMTEPKRNVLDLILADHREVEKLLGTFDSVPIEGRDQYFCHVVQELVRHEMAEELVVYPALRSDAPGGDTQADRRISEQSKAEEMLDAMEKMDPTTEEFTARFIQLREAVLEHAKAEESQTLPLIRSSEDPAKLETLGARYNKAKAAAPTHPHPHAPDTPPGNMVLGPVAAIMDRMRDAMKKL